MATRPPRPATEPSGGHCRESMCAWPRMERWKCGRPACSAATGTGRRQRKSRSPPTAGSRTGDIGCLTDDGFLAITGRKKAIAITAGGKNVAVEPLEWKLAALPGVAQAVVVGDGRRHLTALLTLDHWAARQLVPQADSQPPAELARHPALRQSLQARVDEINQQLASFEQIKRFAVLPNPLTVEAAELTPTLKIRRAVVEARYAEEIEALYARRTA